MFRYGIDLSLIHICQSKAVKTVMQMSALWGEGMILHDPLTLAVVLSDEFVRFEEGNLLEMCIRDRKRIDTDKKFPLRKGWWSPIVVLHNLIFFG